MEQRKFTTAQITVYDHTQETLKECYCTLSQINYKHLKTPRASEKMLLAKLEEFFKNSHSTCAFLHKEYPNNLNMLHMLRFFEHNIKFIKQAKAE